MYPFVFCPPSTTFVIQDARIYENLEYWQELAGEMVADETGEEEKTEKEFITMCNIRPLFVSKA